MAARPTRSRRGPTARGTSSVPRASAAGARPAGPPGPPPGGLARPRLVGTATAIGAYFARMAHYEGASVPAFERLRDELASHDAPASLVRAADRAARDEVRHTRAMGRLARASGAAIPAVRVR